MIEMSDENSSMVQRSVTFSPIGSFFMWSIVKIGLKKVLLELGGMSPKE